MLFIVGTGVLTCSIGLNCVIFVIVNERKSHTNKILFTIKD